MVNFWGVSWLGFYSTMYSSPNHYQNANCENVLLTFMCHRVTLDNLDFWHCTYISFQFSVQLDSGQFQENTSEYLKWKEWRERAEQELRHSVRDTSKK